MDKDELVSLIEALLFANGKALKIKSIVELIECTEDEIKEALECLRQRLIDSNSGIQLVEVDGSYQLATLEKYYSYISKMLDNRPKPTLSQAAFEVLAIIAYNSNITRAEIEKIRGVSSDSAINKLLEYNLIEDAGRLDAPR